MAGNPCEGKSDLWSGGLPLWRESLAAVVVAIVVDRLKEKMSHCEDA